MQQYQILVILKYAFGPILCLLGLPAIAGIAKENLDFTLLHYRIAQVISTCGHALFISAFFRAAIIFVLPLAFIIRSAYPSLFVHR
jgi:hypothetical protein